MAAQLYCIGSLGKRNIEAEKFYRNRKCKL